MRPVRPLERWEIAAAAGMWEAELLEVYGSAAELPEAAERPSFFEDVVHPACEGWWAIGDGTRVLAILGLKHEHIAHLYVNPEARSRGLGRQLVEHSKTIYPARLTVETSERVTGFYAALGFVEDETAEDEVRMVWRGFPEVRLR